MDRQQIDINPALFKLFLIKAEEEGRQFQRGSNCHCPIAEYLHTLPEYEGARVSNYSVKLPSGKCFGLPPWARSFICAFDMGHSTIRALAVAVRL